MRAKDEVIFAYVDEPPKGRTVNIYMLKLRPHELIDTLGAAFLYQLDPFLKVPGFESVLDSNMLRDRNITSASSILGRAWDDAKRDTGYKKGKPDKDR